MKVIRSCLLLLAIILTPFTLSIASYQQEALRVANNAIGHEIGDYTLIDQDGKRFSLREITGKPLVINLIYTNCKHICPTITMHLQEAFKKAGDDFGIKFTALTIGFDVENDTPERMKLYGSGFTDDFDKWRFASSDKETIERIARDLGFYFKKGSGGFEHLNMVTVINPEGKVYKHIYGLDLKPPDILGPVYQSINNVKISFNSSQGLMERIKLFCYKYDGTTGGYRLDYGLLITLIAGTLLQGATMITIIYYVWGRGFRRP